MLHGFAAMRDCIRSQKKRTSQGTSPLMDSHGDEAPLR
jgi:hypothetical protein